MNKKGQGLSLNTIIIAIIVIIVLVIIILITTGQLQKFTTATEKQAPSDCVNSGGFCTSTESCESYGGSSLSGVNCGEGRVCCVRNV